jgi:hypothetical protein
VQVEKSKINLDELGIKDEFVKVYVITSDGIFLVKYLGILTGHFTHVPLITP